MRWIEYTERLCITQEKSKPVGRTGQAPYIPVSEARGFTALSLILGSNRYAGAQKSGHPGHRGK